MGSKVDINVLVLNRAIDQMNRLKGINSSKIRIPATQGGGLVVNEVEALAKEFDQIHTEIGKMIGSTQQFLIKARNAYQDADRKSASGIQGN